MTFSCVTVEKKIKNKIPVETPFSTTVLRLALIMEPMQSRVCVRPSRGNMKHTPLTDQLMPVHDVGDDVSHYHSIELIIHI